MNSSIRTMEYATEYSKSIIWGKDLAWKKKSLLLVVDIKGSHNKYTASNLDDIDHGDFFKRFRGAKIVEMKTTSFFFYGKST